MLIIANKGRYLVKKCQKHVYVICEGSLIGMYNWVRNHSDAGTGGPVAPQYLSGQLTLFEPGRADYPHLLLMAPPKFFNFRHH